MPKSIYTQYQYSSGEGGRLRAVLLKDPASDVEIIPYSVQIVTVQGSLDDAYNFLYRGTSHKRINMLGVRYHEKTIGYLMVPERNIFTREEIDVSIYEKNGKVYFSVYEQTHYD